VTDAERADARPAGAESDLARRIEALAAAGPNGDEALAGSVREALVELGAAVDRGLSALGASLSAYSSAELGPRLDGLRHSVDEIAGHRATLDTAVGGLRDRLDQLVDVEAVTSLRGDLADALDEQAADLRETLAANAAEVRGALDDGLVALRGALDDGTATLRDAVRDDLAGVREALADCTDALRSATGELTGGVEQLATAGRGLLGYLVERDRLLEAERDEMLHALLDDFADGLSSKERRALRARLGDALDRRRDARDAERWRAAQPAGQTGTPEPPDLSAFDAPDRSRRTAKKRSVAKGAPKRAPASAKNAPKE
jgi:hypothetical protein